MGSFHRTALLAALLASAGSCTRTRTVAAGPSAEPRTIRVGTWNLEHFGQRDKFRQRSDAPPNRTAEQVAAIANFIEAMAVDVLAVQEIGGPEPMRRLLAHLDPSYRFCLGTTGVYDDTRISVGFLWRSDRVRLLQCEEMTDFPSFRDGLPVFHRKPVNAVFRVVDGDRTGMDFRAITVHLKASRGTQNEKKRQAEVAVLREYLQALAARTEEDRDVVVLGDFNHGPEAPAHQTFCAGDCVRYAAGDPSPTIVWFDTPIDHLALTPGIREEVVPDSYRVHSGRVDFSLDPEALAAAKTAWRTTYSDHFPVTLDFSGLLDRDPAATFTAPTHRIPAVGLTPDK